MKIDAHQHFWKYDPQRDAWINDSMSVLKRDFLPEHLAPILKENDIDGCVAVQADQSETETEFLLHLAAQNSLIKGVVGWVDLQSDSISQRLDYLSQNQKLKGFRHIVQTEPKGFLTRPNFLKGVDLLTRYNFSYDILIYYHQLEVAIEFVKRFPNQKFVVDHLAKPNIKNAEFTQWSKGIAQLAAYENVWCKLSGFTTEASWEHWKYEDFTPYFDLVLNQFGAKRILYGSDWPVCLLAASYKSQLSVVERFVETLTASEKDQIMGGNAIHFYNL